MATINAPVAGLPIEARPYAPADRLPDPSPPTGVSTEAYNPSQALFGDQPAGITRAVRSAGRLVANFASGQWTLGPGAGTLTQGYSGFDSAGNVVGVRSRTGQPEMVQLTIGGADNAINRLTLSSPATNLLTKALAGKFGLWVHIASQPGYQVGGSLAGVMEVELTTNASRFYSNGLVVGFNSNQLREGWNFLKFVQRDTAAYRSGAPTTEYHPFGVVAACYGTGVDANIVDAPLTELRINVSNMAGATLTFDSIWTGFDSIAQLVLGCDAAGSDLLQHGLPSFTQYGWKGYFAIPGRIWTSGSYTVSDWSALPVNAMALYRQHGWDCVNHSTNHIPVGALASAGAVDYEVTAVQAQYANAGLLRGAEFYASPQSSSSRLAEAVIKNRGFKAQRHARKWNVSVTPWGLDNPHHIGAIDFGSATAGGISSTTGTAAGSVAGWQTFTKLQRFVDTLIDYGDTAFPFWHGITTLGDSGLGNDLTGDNLLITKSAFEKFMAYIKMKEDAGLIRVRDGMTGFYYGVGR